MPSRFWVYWTRLTAPIWFWWKQPTEHQVMRYHQLFDHEPEPCTFRMKCRGPLTVITPDGRHVVIERSGAVMGEWCCSPCSRSRSPDSR